MITINSLFWTRVRIALMLLAFIAAFWAIPFTMSLLMLVGNDSFDDVDFQADHVAGDLEVGTSLRLPERGILGGARYCVIVVRDRQGRLIDTLYQGPSAYPEAPRRPSFVAASDKQVTYQIPEEGERDFQLPTFMGEAPPESRKKALERHES
jgi:hypothetical protein